MWDTAYFEQIALTDEKATVTAHTNTQTHTRTHAGIHTHTHTHKEITRLVH